MPSMSFCQIFPPPVPSRAGQMGMARPLYRPLPLQGWEVQDLSVVYRPPRSLPRQPPLVGEAQACCLLLEQRRVLEQPRVNSHG